MDSLRFLAARWVLPVSGRSIENGVVALQDREIVAVLPRQDLARRFPGAQLEDHGQAIITPGLINLHTHLDYSALALFDNESSLFAWIKGLVGRASGWSPDEWRQSALAGAEEIALSGTTCVCDSSLTGQAAWALARLGLRGVVGLELFGVSPGEAGARWQDWLARREALASAADPALSSALASGLVRLTVAPHAPYTVCPQLWEMARDWAEREDLPVLAHLSESDAECRWIAGQDHDLDNFLETMTPGGIPGGARSLSWRGHGLSPVAHLAAHRLLTSRTIAAHAVKVDDRDLELLAARGTAVAHCPRSNARLRNGVAPLARMAESSIRLGFGTDSAASTDNLDVLAEARFALAVQRAIDPGFSWSAERAFHHLTLGAAEALGLAGQIGSLEPGKRADIAVFQVERPAPAAASRPYDLLIYGQTCISELIVDGRTVVGGGVVKPAGEAPRAGTAAAAGD